MIKLSVNRLAPPAKFAEPRSRKTLTRSCHSGGHEPLLQRRVLVAGSVLFSTSVHYQARAEDAVEAAGSPLGSASSASTAVEKPPRVTARVFWDVSVAGSEPFRIVVGLFGDDSPLAVSRFSFISRGDEGLSYRKTAFDLIRPGSIVRNGGVRDFMIGSRDVSVPGGSEVSEAAIKELQTSRFKHTSAGLVSLLLLPEVEPPVPQTRLVATGGKFVSVVDPVAQGPNGSAVIFTLDAAPELDACAVVIGRVEEGMDVIEAIGGLPYNVPKTDSPFLSVAKAIGDKRGRVAEKGFGRPLVKVTVTASGALQQ